MHIKQITISGFKSYRDAIKVGPYSPGHNVVVGRNGSGKSNFFDAVRFVLSDSFSSLRAEERVALLHEGAGTSVMSAYVEMVFDNSDGRLPFDKDEVALRRMVGLKKDEYVLDRKNVSRTEVFNLLESAGFSRSNPYYIVQQGKVAALCGMTDKQRLDLLKEVAGTRVYDERREESLKIMEETDGKREKIAEVLAYIETRLGELESEKEELKAFQRLDKDRRALEYTIHVKEVDDATKTLEEIEADKAHGASRSEEMQERLAAVQKRMSAEETQLKASEANLEPLLEERTSLDKERRSGIDKVAKLQVTVSEAEQIANNAREALEAAARELDVVSAAIEERREELEPLEANFNTVRNEEQRIRKEIKECEEGALALRIKANRINQFSSVQERDAHLKKELRKARKDRDSFNTQLAEARIDLERLREACARNEAKIQENQAAVNEMNRSMGAGDTDTTELNKKRDELHAQRQELWRKESDLVSKIKVLRNGMGRLEGNKRSAFGSETHNAVSAVMQASWNDPNRFGPDRVFGPLVDLLRVDPKFTTAADVTAGGALTHVVVDNDATAAALVKIMQQRRAGRATFIPLSRLDRNQRPPPDATADAIPLVSRISCEDRFWPAVQQVFGRTMVTRSVDVATAMSRDLGVDCITLDGDQVNRRGAMTGGYMDASRSRIDAARALREAEDELRKLEPEHERLRDHVNQIEAELSQVQNESQRRMALERSAHSKLQRLHADLQQLQVYKRQDEANLPRATERITTLEESIQTAEKSVTVIENELQTPMTSGLSPQEEAQLEQFKQSLNNLRVALKPQTEERGRLERQVTKLKSELEGNLERKRAELKEIVDREGLTQSTGAGELIDEDEQLSLAEALAKRRQELRQAEASLTQVEGNIAATSKRIEELSTLSKSLETKLEKDREEESKIQRELEEDRQRGEKRYGHAALAKQKKETAERKIRELGSLPADFEKYRGIQQKTLVKNLKKVNGKLQEYSHVNKKALEQFMSFTEKRETLQAQKDELETGAESIRRLIDRLDMRKDEDILRTYKGVAKFFTEVFAELVPGGKAKLVMLKNKNREPSEEDDGGRLQYSGVAMKIAFTSTGEAYLLQQLSGGQKSIVALALIFAIQRLDPAPFYLFDEIDANLDATYRQAVANLILKQARNNTQFITTTFRPEFVNAGDKWFGVTHRRKVSSVDEVEQDVALTFITDEPTNR